MTITKSSAYYPGVRVFTANQLQYDVPMIYLEEIVESVGAERLSLVIFSAITDAMVDVNNQPV